MTIPLPEPVAFKRWPHSTTGDPAVECALFAADQMRAYGDARAAEEREKVARIIGGWMTATYGWQGDDPCGEVKARADHAEECIRRIGAAIRSDAPKR